MNLSYFKKQQIELSHDFTEALLLNTQHVHFAVHMPMAQ